MSENKFRVKWYASDGYVGSDRPHHFSIDETELDEDFDDGDLEVLFYDSLQGAFENKVVPESSDLDAFKEWARAAIAKTRSGA